MLDGEYDRLLIMAKWQWDSRLETGIELIDEQHLELFSRIDKLEIALYSGMGSAELTYLIQYLMEYVVEHFAAEEKILDGINYPDLAKHIKQHQEFRQVVNEIISSCRDKGADRFLAIEVDKMMRSWWENHILKLDMDYVTYVRNRKPDKL